MHCSTSSSSKSADADPSSSTTSSSATIKKTQQQYSQYIQNGGDGNSVLLNRSQALGYDNNFLSKLGFSASDTQHLFRASCGPGCPLRLGEDKESIKEGATIVDLGCGAGHDIILARRMVGSTGLVVGVDVTPDMLQAARHNIQQYLGDESTNNIQLVEGPLDNPEWVCQKVGSNIADIVISNGVLNLCDDKQKAFQTAYDLLKSGGRFLLSDLCKVPTNPTASLVTDCAVCSS